MPLKISSRLRAIRKLQENVQHTSRLRTDIPAGMASAAPPLGSMLGQRSINIANFVKEFNDRTAKMKKGIPLPTRAKATSDKAFDLDIHQPPATYFIKQGNFNCSLSSYLLIRFQFVQSILIAVRFGFSI